MSGINIILIVVLLALPALLVFSEEGPGSKHAPALIALAAGLIAGAIAQRSRLCMMGGIRDVMLLKDWTLICGFIAIFVVTLIGNLILGKFKLGFVDQPVAHTEWLWNFLGMAAVGLGSTMLGGCPMRQLILAGEGNSDSAVAVLGMLIGAAFCHNFSLASSANGTTLNGRIACVAVIVIMLIVAVCNTKKAKN